MRELFLTGPYPDDDGNYIYSVRIDRRNGPTVASLRLTGDQLAVTAPAGGTLLPVPSFDQAEVGAAFQRAMEALPDKVTLWYPDRSDELSNDQIERLLKGGYLFEDSLFDDWYDDVRYDTAVAVIEEYVDDEDLELLNPDQRDELRWAVEERDDSNPEQELLRLTPDKWFRYRLDVEAPEAVDDAELPALLAEIQEVLGPHAVSEEQLRALLADAPYGGGLYLFWHGDVEQMVRAAQRTDNGGNPVAQTLSVTGGSLICFNRFNGSGYDIDLPDGLTVSVPFDRNRLTLDVGDGSYSEWLCGGLSSRRNARINIITTKE